MSHPAPPHHPSPPSWLARLRQALRWGDTGPQQVQALRTQVDELAAQLHATRRAAEGFQAQATAQLAGYAAQLASHEAHLQSHAHTLPAHEQHLQALQAEASRVHARLGLDRPEASAALREAFYEALEAQFRGSPQDVQRRMAVHRHWIDQAPAGPIWDLGCGRGEWLELLQSWGRPACGVDLGQRNVAHLQSRGLPAEQGDALTWIAHQPDQTAAAITAFHLVEHLAWDDLLLLVAHAVRVLQPGGILLLETPNIENWLVATQTFWIDPTHLRPLPPALLDFLARQAGLQVLTLQRLNAPEEDPPPDSPSPLREALQAGRDIALVARKPS